ncbi:amidinotransferase [Stieleria marina]|uniref:Inosamine-phosphate amidinotransferase 1 n=1 Tax=Stieleria marina TaxID=1930275 RepID=A0A517P0J1_9BACT|nr:Inosamine-phosphate amidinotransferase 1 [Planctomycetes bacterium K23_9]
MKGLEMETLEKSAVVHSKTDCPVNSHNEWDPLEEVIVGSVDTAMFPGWSRINEVTVPPGEWARIERNVGGKGVPYPSEMVSRAQEDLAEFVAILEGEGVVVRKVDRTDFSRSFQPPSWGVDCGFCSANPRDPFLVIGNEIIEAPMADRSRYFEAWAYRSLFKEYFHAGAKWTSAPKPQLLDDLYDSQYRVPQSGERMRFIATEFEPVFDAADFVRCGRDIFAQKSHVTNDMGIMWLQRHLGDDYRVHIIESRNPENIHIDTSFLPLAPGKVMVNPDYVDIDRLPSVLDDWEILIPPAPVGNADPLRICSPWISLNVLMLDQDRIVVERRQEPLIRALKEWGFTPIPCSFEHYFPFMGSFHCATLDIRRRGKLQSYF